MNTQYDQSFLLNFDQQKIKTIYARITALSLDELPLETIEGKISSGSINFDGTSSLRRTCSLSLGLDSLDYTFYYWTLKSKFKLEIGIQNYIDKNYPDIIWFKMGIYVITSFSPSQNANGAYTISIQGKDKMCLLNGEIGGALESSIDFGTISQETEEGTWEIVKLKIRQIIRNAVHVYGNEPYHNIIIKDLEDMGLELLEYRYETPMYLYTDDSDSHYLFKNVLLENDEKIYYYKDETDNWVGPHSLKSLPNDCFVQLVNPLTGTKDGKWIYTANEDTAQKYKFAKIEYGDTAGYRTTDLVYPDDLIANVGETIVSVLDKIKAMLVEFEYFYNEDGQFVFQKKASYLKTMWGPNADTEKIIASAENSYAYVFSGNNLIESISNNPKIENIKNDFSIWGSRKSVSGEALPIHMRYAIDLKPVLYVNYEGQEFNTTDYDWRELIYQMGLDYFKHGEKDNFEITIGKLNPKYYPTGYTGYENYYTDLQGFWRFLYNPNPAEEEKENFYLTGENKYWSKTVFEASENLDFWFDFLDTNGSLGEFNVRKIGPRAKPVNDNAIKGIYFKETPSIIFVEDINQEEQINSYKYIQIGKENDYMFSISAQGKSAKDKLDELLNAHSYYAETITINSVPIYYLEPNQRIYLYDEQTKIDGEYIINRISFSLAYNGKMSISASKVAEDITQ